MRFKYFPMMYRVTCSDALRSYHFRKTRRQIQHKVEILQKLMNICKRLARSKVTAIK